MSLLKPDAAHSDAPLWGSSAVPAVAVGIPLQQPPGGVSPSAIDPVPLIDGGTASLLGATNAFTIVQRPSLTEALCAACERSNIYDIYDFTTGMHLFVAKERSETCARFCCAPNHSLFVEFKTVAGYNPMQSHHVDIDMLPTILTLEREGCPLNKPCLSCCACSSVCKDGMFLHAGPVGEAPVGTLRSEHPGCVGFATQPQLAGGFTPTVNIMERSAAGPHAFAPLAKLEGPTCFGGCSELCFSSTFTISSMHTSAQLETKLKLGDVATIVKRKPADLDGALREAVTDADVYTLEINPAAHLAPQQKATLLATLVLTDYMFFERDGAACNGNGCTLCLMHCGGCLCEFKLRGNGGGGQPGGGGGGSGFMADQ